MHGIMGLYDFVIVGVWEYVRVTCCSICVCCVCGVVWYGDVLYDTDE
jgi:hypothetical protein